MLVMATDGRDAEYVVQAKDQLRTMIQALSMVITATEKYPMSIEEIEQECEIRKQAVLTYAEEPEAPKITMVQFSTDLENDCLEVLVQVGDSHEWQRLLSHPLSKWQIYAESFYGKTKEQAIADYERAHGPLGD